jgi:hypothetical protein
MRITPSFREKLALILAGEPTDTRRQSGNVVDKRGKIRTHEEEAAIIKSLREGRPKHPNVPRDPKRQREFFNDMSRKSRKAWE